MVSKRNITTPQQQPVSTKTAETTTSPHDLGSRVESAFESFNKLEQDMTLLLDALKAQHASMVDLGEKRFYTALQFHSFVDKTPLAKVAGHACNNSSNEKSPDLVDTESEGSSPFPPESPKTEPSDGEVAAGTEPEGNDIPTEKKESDSGDGDSKKPASRRGNAKEEHKESKTPAAPEVVEKKDPTFAAIQKSVQNVTTLHANEFQQDIVGYTEQWIKTVSDRIKVRQMQFRESESKLQHYSKKMDGLGVKQKRQQQRDKPLPPKQQERLDRNTLKLRSAQEGYNDSGQSLVLLIEEVTQRAWKDFYPLLMKIMWFDFNYEKEIHELCSNLEINIVQLEQIGQDHKLNSENGRLEQIEKARAEELYTGTKHVVCPLVDSTPKSANKQHKDDEWL